MAYSVTDAVPAEHSQEGFAGDAIVGLGDINEGGIEGLAKFSGCLHKLSHYKDMIGERALLSETSLALR